MDGGGIGIYPIFAPWKPRSRDGRPSITDGSTPIGSSRILPANRSLSSIRRDIRTRLRPPGENAYRPARSTSTENAPPRMRCFPPARSWPITAPRGRSQASRVPSRFSTKMTISLLWPNLPDSRSSPAATTSKTHCCPLFETATGIGLLPHPSIVWDEERPESSSSHLHLWQNGPCRRTLAKAASQKFIGHWYVGSP